MYFKFYTIFVFFNYIYAHILLIYIIHVHVCLLDTISQTNILFLQILASFVCMEFEVRVCHYRLRSDPIIAVFDYVVPATIQLGRRLWVRSPATSYHRRKHGTGSSIA